MLDEGTFASSNVSSSHVDDDFSGVFHFISFHICIDEWWRFFGHRCEDNTNQDERCYVFNPRAGDTLRREREKRE